MPGRRAKTLILPATNNTRLWRQFLQQVLVEPEMSDDEHDALCDKIMLRIEQAQPRAAGEYVDPSQHIH